MERNVQLTLESFRILLFLFAITLVLAACGPKQHSTEKFKAYSGVVENSEELVSIKLFFKDTTKDYVNDYVDWVKVGENHIDHKKYGEIKINPGSYQIAWGRVFNFSPMIKASGKEERNWSTKVTLEAGHTYTIHARRTVGHGYKFYSWITDDTAGHVVWGRQFIPGPYDNLLK